MLCKPDAAEKGDLRNTERQSAFPKTVLASVEPLETLVFQRISYFFIRQVLLPRRD